MRTKSLGKTTRSVVDAVQRKIADGGYRVGDALGGEVELAAALGVSRTTVRNAMGHLESLRIVERQAGKGKGYTLQSIARNENMGPHRRPELLLLRTAPSAMVMDTFDAVRSSPYADRFRITLLATDPGPNKDYNYAELLNNLPDKYRHVILYPLDLPEVEDAIRRAFDRGVTVVQLDRYLKDLPAPVVMPDSHAAGYLATRHLLQRNGLPVYYFGNHARPTSAADHYEGWQTAMGEWGYADFERYRVPGLAVEKSEFNLDNRAPAVLDRFLARHTGETVSILAISDLVALFVYEVCARRGLAIGEQVFLAGTGNEAMCDRQTPPLTSVECNREACGREAIRLLVEGHDELRCGFWRHLVPVTLVPRRSSGAPSPSEAQTAVRAAAL